MVFKCKERSMQERLGRHFGAITQQSRFNSRKTLPHQARSFQVDRYFPPLGNRHGLDPQ